MNRQINSTGISETTLRYLKMLELEENPVNKTRVIATHFVDSPIHDSMQTRMSVSDYSHNNSPLESSAFTVNNESQIPGDSFFNQPIYGQQLNTDALLGSYAVDANDENLMLDDSTFDQPTLRQFTLNQIPYRSEADDQLVEIADCYQEERDMTLSESRDMTLSESCMMFKSPPFKKRKSRSFFNSTSPQNSESFNITAKPIDHFRRTPPNNSYIHPYSGLATQVLFGDESISTSVIYSQKVVDEPEVLQENSCDFVERSENYSQLSSQQESQKIEEDLSSSTLDETLMPEKCRNQELEKSFMQNQKLNISTMYANRFIVNTTSHLISNFYKVQKNQDWNAIADEMIDLVEPKLDYLHAREWIEKRVTLGCKDQDICEEDAYSCENIRESLEEIEKSFESPDHSLIASTPKANRDKSEIVFSQEIFKIGSDSKIEKSQAELKPHSQNINTESRPVASISESIVGSSERGSSSHKLTSNVQSNQKDDSTHFSFRYNLSNIDFDNAIDTRMSFQIEKPAEASLALTLGNQSRSIAGNLVQVLQSQDPSEALQMLSQQNPA